MSKLDLEEIEREIKSIEEEEEPFYRIDNNRDQLLVIIAKLLLCLTKNTLNK